MIVYENQHYHDSIAISGKNEVGYLNERAGENKIIEMEKSLRI